MEYKMQYKIAIIGEAWGEREERERRPFVGPAGWMLNSMLKDAGIRRDECFLTNVFNLRPQPTNKIDNLCGSRKDVKHTLTPLSSGKYVLDKYLPELERLRRELIEVNPNVAICAGGTATWALLSDGRISKLRGAVATSTVIPRLKCLPIYHPSYILQGSYEARYVTVLDLIKARRESEYSYIKLPRRTVYTEPKLIDLEWFETEHIRPAKRMAVDIETQGERITCIGFAPSREVALVVPFQDRRQPGGNYWPSLGEEAAAIEWVRKVLNIRSIELVFHNGMFDITRLWRGYGIRPHDAAHDTMLLHHALQPESLKSLGFLGSVYTDESAWKLSVRLKHKETIKKEDE